LAETLLYSKVYTPSFGSQGSEETIKFDITTCLQLSSNPIVDISAVYSCNAPNRFACKS
jgi:hypothetical protein